MHASPMIDGLRELLTSFKGPTLLSPSWRMPPRRAEPVDLVGDYEPVAIPGTIDPVIGYEVPQGHLFFCEGVALGTDFWRTREGVGGRVIQNRELWLQDAARVTVKLNGVPIAPGAGQAIYDRRTRNDAHRLDWKGYLDDITPLDQRTYGDVVFVPLIAYTPRSYNTLTNPGTPTVYYESTLRFRGGSSSGLTSIAPLRRLFVGGDRVTVSLDLANVAGFDGETIHFRARIRGWVFPTTWTAEKASGVQAE